MLVDEAASPALLDDQIKPFSLASRAAILWLLEDEYRRA